MTEDELLVEEAMTAAASGSAGHWPTVAGYLHDEVLRLRSLLAARDENLRSEAASWEDICDALSQQAAEAKQKTQTDAKYIEWLQDRLRYLGDQEDEADE